MKKVVKFIPNILTISRIIMSVLFASSILNYFAFRKGDFINIVALFIAICFSDLLDGKIARKTGNTSAFGAKLDVFADLFFIVLSSTTLIILRILPLWFLGFICLKFFEFLITSGIIISNNDSTGMIFVFDRIGRIVSASFFIIPGLACVFQVLIHSAAGFLINTLLYTLLAGGVCSSYSRIRCCFKKRLGDI